jgi:predicted lipoprotein with Yx(FWY)xxD motif
MRKWRTVSLAGVAATMLLATACGAEEPQSTDTKLVQPAAGNGSGKANGNAADGNAGGAAEKPQSAGQLAVRKDSKLGSMVTDSAGMTLYRFDKDTNKPPASNCKGSCATTWPPLLAGSAGLSGISVQGVDKALLGTITRDDGSLQVTLNGWALYYFASDSAPGDAKGQGVGGVWFAATPEGKKATPSMASSSSSSSYGY